MIEPQIGCPKDDLDTPALCIDLDVMERNVQTMVDTCRRHDVQWRPHSKCHKSIAIARKLIQAGAIGVTCAKLGEAEVMAQGGIKDLLIANMVVGPHKLQRLAQLCRQADPIVCVDHPDQVAAMSAVMSQAQVTPRVLVEVDIGLERVGVAAGRQSAELARQVHRAPGLTLAGIMGYEGHLLQVKDLLEKESNIHAALDLLNQTQQLLLDQDLPCPIVSCGGTGSYVFAVQHEGITEIQAGGAIFMDEYYRNLCQVTDLDFALTVLATVVSRPTADRAIIDAGRKTMNIELEKPRVVGREGIFVEALSAEHGQLRVEPVAEDLRIGDRLELIPGYGDLTTVLHDRFYGFRGERLEVIWPLDGRGRLQ